MLEQEHENHEVSKNDNAVNGPLVDLDGSYHQQEDGEDEEQLEQEDRYYTKHYAHKVSFGKYNNMIRLLLSHSELGGSRERSTGNVSLENSRNGKSSGKKFAPGLSSFLRRHRKTLLFHAYIFLWLSHKNICTCIICFHAFK